MPHRGWQAQATPLRLQGLPVTLLLLLVMLRLVMLRLVMLRLLAKLLLGRRPQGRRLQGRRLAPGRQPHLPWARQQQQARPAAAAVAQSWPCAAGAPPG